MNSVVHRKRREIWDERIGNRAMDTVDLGSLPNNKRFFMIVSTLEFDGTLLRFSIPNARFESLDVPGKARAVDFFIPYYAIEGSSRKVENTTGRLHTT
jgi:L-rhamnose isomerase